MRPAADELARALEQVEIRTPRFRVVTNVTASVVRDAAHIRELLAAQVCAPVLWEESMRWAISQGVREFVEPGPGKVLAGLMGKIDETARVRCAATPSDLTSAPSGA